MHLFAYHEYQPTSSRSSSKLPYFIAHALHQTKIHPSVTFAALILLQRLKTRFPTSKGSGRRFFITAFMIASKVLCDNKYSNKFWTIVGQGMFELQEINHMEREMCQYLDWNLNVEPGTLKEFEYMVRKNFAGPGPYPTHVLPTIAKLTTFTMSRFPVVDKDTTSSTLSFDPRLASPIKDHQFPQFSPSITPNIPLLCRSDSTSTISTASPPTPPGVADHSATVAELNNNCSSSSIRKPHGLHRGATNLEPKEYSFAIPSVW